MIICLKTELMPLAEELLEMLLVYGLAQGPRDHSGECEGDRGPFHTGNLLTGCYRNLPLYIYFTVQMTLDTPVQPTSHQGSILEVQFCYKHCFFLIPHLL